MRFVRRPCRSLTLGFAACLLAAMALRGVAQQPTPPPRDPLMTLMVSQPKLEVPGDAKPSAVFDPPVVIPGEEAYLRVVLDALEESIDWPEKLAGPRQLEISAGGQGQILQMTGTNMLPRSAMNYRVRASATGTFTIPEFVVRVGGRPVTVPATQLQVVSVLPPSAPPAAQLVLDVPATNLYVGQAIPAHIRLPGSASGVVQGLIQPQLIGPGILVDQGATRQRIEMMPNHGAMVPTFIYETTFTPVTAGTQAIFAQGFTAGRHISGPIIITGPATIPGGPPQYTLVESERITLNVRPLPREGQLPGFTGTIGDLAVGPPFLASSTVRVGDPVPLSVVVTNRGDAPLARVVPPPAPQVPNWQVVLTSDFSPAQPVAPRPRMAPGLIPSGLHGDLEGVVTFHYTLIPLSESVHMTPPIPFSAFDPGTGAYVDLTIPSVPVTVQPGTVPADYASLMQANAVGAEPEKKLALSSLAPSRGRLAASLVPPQQRDWFPFVQLAPAALFFGLWSWDRRRRYLELHPDVVLRRRARRALQKQRRVLYRAARAADAPRFAAAAVDAMRVACAPHYPAEPRALVGTDVIPLLPEPERTGKAGEVVRRFFAVTDAVRFDTTPPNAAELLPLQPDLELVLQQLEQTL